ncbi:MAG: hypothetical protein LBK95_17755 [Bifidobacteriaceae bacterium]|jgi:putative FmdB family regulatory protein|nr:hypothetical protein [Bifidobacteriaceae bacterium]
MPNYAYRCDQHAVFTMAVPLAEAIADAMATVACPTCGRATRRVYTAPMINFGGALHKAIDASKATADAPAVVTSIPPRT